jgi:hypothetical protein
MGWTSCTSNSGQTLAVTKPPAVGSTTTNAETFVLATSPDEILGTWQSGNYYIRFDGDGTFRLAHALDRLTSQPVAIGSYLFQGTNMAIKEISVSGVPSAGDEIGNYEIKLMERGNIRIVLIRDQSRGRAGDLVREYVPVR